MTGRGEVAVRRRAQHEPVAEGRELERHEALLVVLGVGDGARADQVRAERIEAASGVATTNRSA